jgi:hypothetical protein
VPDAPEETEGDSVFDGPDPGLWGDSTRIGPAIASLKAVQDVLAMMKGSSPREVGPYYAACLPFLGHLERQAKEELAAMLLAAYGVPVDLDTEEPALEGTRPDIAVVPAPSGGPFEGAGRPRALGAPPPDREAP